MDVVDRDVEKAEIEASRTYSRESLRRRSKDSGKPASQVSTHSSSSGTTSSSSLSGVGAGIRSRATTSDLERRSTHPVEIHRTETHRLQHTHTLGATKTEIRDSRRPLPDFGGGKPYPQPLPAQEEYVVEFSGPDDPLHPQNWAFNKKVLIGAMLAYTCICSTFTSSIFSSSTRALAAHFHVSVEVATLSSSLYILGYAFGPIMWGPFSELRGRKLPILIGMFGFSIFQVAVAVAKDLQTVMIGRFFGGIFGSCPLSIVAAVFADMFNNKQRGTAIVIFSTMVFLGPMLAPFIGGFIVTSYLGWRWTSWIPGFMGFAAFGLNLLFLQESYPPIVLVGKAQELRRRTKNWGIHAKQEEVEVDLRELVTKNFSRPIRLLISEPIVLLVSLYMSFIYGLLYCFLTAYPIVFSGVYHMTPGVAGLAFFGMVAGLFTVSAVIIYLSGDYNKKLAANRGIPVPEWRLPPVIVGGAFFAGGLFWFGWSGYTGKVHWIVPILSGLLTGFGLLSIFICLFNYLIDTYLMFAASVIAANTFVRSLFAAGFPLFSRQMFNNLGIEWAATLLGCLALVMVPIPLLFYLFGARIRRRSKFAPSLDLKMPPPIQEDTSESGVDSNGEKGKGPEE